MFATIIFIYIKYQIKYKNLTLHVINLPLTRDREVPVASSRQIIFIELIVMFGELRCYAQKKGVFLIGQMKLEGQKLLSV